MIITVVAVVPACSAHGASGSATGPSFFAESTAGASPDAGGVDDATFCQAARQAGVTNSAPAGDPATLLPALDRLKTQAPAAIRDDFGTFVALEHVLLNPSGADDSHRAGLNQPGTRAALAHVKDYLATTCHIG